MAKVKTKTKHCWKGEKAVTEKMNLKVWCNSDLAYFCTPKNKGDLVAQLVEHNTFNVGVLGSNPNGITVYD